ncbi:hypothetical protein NDA13_002721 [Ustilago tritici]|nr:hypothetical protein NDA13_002721 [Ustilago tritici]
METIQHWLDGKIDFAGQRLADRLMQESLVAAAVISFILGYFLQNLQLCMLTSLASTLVIALVTVPAWPLYTKHHVEWLPARTQDSDSKK